MTTRFRLALFAGAVALAGCGDSFNAGPIRFARSERLALDLDGKPRLQAAITETLNDMYGASPRTPRAPEGNPLPLGGVYLGNHFTVAGDQAGGQQVQLAKYHDSSLGRDVLLRGGYSLYREHCLHCHGASGDGMGPTAPFLWPRPRDYRRGVFKFTSTTTEKPTRDDLRRIVLHGIPNSSMPSFEALMTPNEIEQVIDFVIYLAMRGETELLLANEAAALGDEENSQISSGTPNEEIAQYYASMVFDKWRNADQQVLDPPVERVASTPESIRRGRNLFLGQTSEKLECAGCHGPRAKGNGPSFIEPDVFNDIVFRGLGTAEFDETSALDTIVTQQQTSGGPVAIGDLPETIASTPGDGPIVDVPMADLIERLEDRDLIERVAGNRFRATPGAEEALPQLKQERDLWIASLDDWGDPLRPANLNKGMYKGGRRPLDLYWRIAKGINGAKMPSHSTAVKPEQIWDLVNFVLTLPYEPELLEDAPLTAPPATTTAQVARSR